MKTLKSKFIFWICVLFILMGIIIFIPLSIILPKKITSQILKRDIKIAQYLSREAQEQLLVDNRLALRVLLGDRLENLSDGVYIFIRRPDGAIVSSTFNKGFPKGLLNINHPAWSADSVKEFISSGKKVYDISVPILKGELGSLHLGVSLESSRGEIAEFTRINYYVAAVIFTGLGIGILIFTFLGIFLSNRIVKLKDFATRVGHGNLEYHIDVKTNDEIGALAVAFNDMASALSEKIEEINRLNIVKERDRIAIDLHDGCAQDIVSIIKRLELCEKLIKINSDEASKELRLLEEDTKDILNKTRQVIFDLKSQDEDKFNLMKKLQLYLKDYERINKIAVKLDVSVSLDNISKDNIGPLFYIITEALNNVRKHSLAKNVILSIGSNNQVLKIVIRDDGRGFNTDAEKISATEGGKYGLAGMRQRTETLGGRLAINSVLNKGTEVTIEVPLV